MIRTKKKLYIGKKIGIMNELNSEQKDISGGHTWLINMRTSMTPSSTRMRSKFTMKKRINQQNKEMQYTCKRT